MPLPILTTADDARAIVAYLKNKPTGATIAEAKAVVGKQVLDSRKISAYQLWGIITRDGERLKLSPRGWEIARKTKTEQQVFREVLDSIAPYRAALEWIHHQGLDSVTNVDIAAQWHEHQSESLGTENENTIKDQAVCFFRICEAGGLGTVTLGRQGHPTRLRVDRGELATYVEAGPSTPPWEDPSSAEGITTETESGASKPAATAPAAPKEAPSSPPHVPATERMRVFISHGKNTALVEQVETMLGLADIESEVAVKEETTAIPVPEKVFAAMKRCAAGIIIVSVDEGLKDTSGNYAINENVLIEIGAAFVLYDKKVVLLWDKRLPVPSNLQGLYRCEFSGDDLNWGAGMKLMKAIKGFKS